MVGRTYRGIRSHVNLGRGRARTAKGDLQFAEGHRRNQAEIIGTPKKGGRITLTWLFDAPSLYGSFTGDLRPSLRRKRGSPSRTALRSPQLPQGDRRRVLGHLVAGFDAVKDLLRKQDRIGSRFLFHGSIMAPSKDEAQGKNAWISN